MNNYLDKNSKKINDGDVLLVKYADIMPEKKELRIIDTGSIMACATMKDGKFQIVDDRGHEIPLMEPNVPMEDFEIIGKLKN